MSGLKPSDLDMDATWDSPYKLFSRDMQTRMIDLGNELPAANLCMQIAAGYCRATLDKTGRVLFKIVLRLFPFHNFNIMIVLITFKASQEFS